MQELKEFEETKYENHSNLYEKQSEGTKIGKLTKAGTPINIDIGPQLNII